MFAHLLVTAVLMALVGVGLYKLIMWRIRKNKKLQAAFAEKRQSLQERLDDLKKKKKEIKDLAKSIDATKKLADLETEIVELSAQIETLDAKRGK
jgi:septal ring factor EnvC (AmiA/AmiB activator)